MKGIRARLTYANVVATLALVVAVGGASAFAATQLAKNSVGTRQLKKDAVTGAKVKDGSLSGADIGDAVARANEAALAARATFADSADHAASAQVADGATTAGRADLAKTAETALHASDADTLAGQPPSAFQPNGSVRRIDWSVTNCGLGPFTCTTTLVDADGLKLEAECAFDEEIISGTGTLVLIGSGPPGSNFWLNGRILGKAEPVFTEAELGTGQKVLLSLQNLSQIFEGSLILHSPTRTQTFELGLAQNNAGACLVLGTAIVV